jgi:anti-sigma B factor antagonist
MPERLKLEQAQEFQREVEPLLRADRPRLVFDFSEVRQIDSAGVEILLRCLEEATKRDGDLKLASVTPEAAVVLELTRVDRLFEVFASTSDAIESFEAFPPQAFQGPYPWYSAHESEISKMKLAG